uniref:Uncharacterized protein n=1 Tax=Eutreptiella gymnastica TaxID=73025 RepID=A0A7S4LNQ8_9EUGL
MTHRRPHPRCTNGSGMRQAVPTAHSHSIWAVASLALPGIPRSNPKQKHSKAPVLMLRGQGRSLSCPAPAQDVQLRRHPDLQTPPPSSSSLSTTTAKASNPQQQAFGCAQGAQLQNMQTSIAHNSTDIHGIPENKLNDLANLRPEEQDYVSMYGAHVGPMPLPCGLPPPSVPCIRAISGTTANPPTNCTI